MWRDLEITEKRLARRRERELATRRRGAHPLAHIDPEVAYGWMLSECAAATTQRQARQDGLVATVTQVSSAALLAVPGLLFATQAKFPAATRDPLLYLGLLAFGLAFLSALAEQFFSSAAHDKHIQIMHEYYTFRSVKTEDRQSRRQVKIARNLCYAFFALALISTTFGLLLAGVQNGTSTVINPSPTKPGSDAIKAKPT